MGNKFKENDYGMKGEERTCSLSGEYEQTINYVFAVYEKNIVKI